MSDEERVLNLFDTYWFEHGVFTPKPPLSSAKTPPISQQQDQDKPKLNRITTMIRKSYSDQFLSSKDCSPEPDSPSPKSVLGPHLQTILSGKEVASFDDSSPKDNTDNISVGTEDVKPRFSTKSDRVQERRRRKREKSGSRSLSELEFEELKGFMDLGFVFSSEDRDSRLVSIIPGLQRFGRKVDDSDMEIDVSRPYLSEAWECLEDGEREKEKDPLMDWRIPAFGNEMELKDHIRFWAHSVASAVR